jgi:hypothetical protein
MTSKEFILWLKGFSEGVHEYNITPKQWDIVKEKLVEVNDENSKSYQSSVSTNRWNEYQATMSYYKPYQPYTTGGPDEIIKTEE